jgi:hypothetical protein
MKSVGKPDAGNPHVRFDERGRETERLATPQATAPFLDSTKMKDRIVLKSEQPLFKSVASDIKAVVRR